MSYRLIDSNALAIKYPEVNDMPCIFADLPNGLDGNHYDMRKSVLEDIKTEIQEHTQRYTLARESGGMGQVEWSDYLTKADTVIEIIDKHISEKEKNEENQIIFSKGTQGY